jgi:AcrR family transcriptional regulator
MSASRSARARVRAELTREIVDTARAELAEVGAPGLSLRAVARRLEMVPSALYRYFPSRDALLTALITDAYWAVGTAAEAADAEAVARGAPRRARWLATTRVIREWGIAHPHEWALVYGSPVPGYEAPQATVEAALAVTRVLCEIMAAAPGLSRRLAPESEAGSGLPPADAEVAASVEPLAEALLPGLPATQVALAVMAWTQVFGAVTLELGGHYVGGVTDPAVLYHHVMEVLATVLGLD